MSVPVTGVSELVLEVVDLEEAERFYSGLLGLPVVERWPDREAIWVMAGERTRIGLWRPRVGLAGGRGGVPVKGVSELVLEVVDLETAEEFYAGVLGLPVVERWPDRDAIWVMAGDRTRIGLWKPQVGLAGGQGGLHVHFAMHIAEDDYDAAVALLRSRDAEVEEIAFEGAGRAAYVTDPDGNVVELWTWDVGEHLR